jgi:hypothetical protein
VRRALGERSAHLLAVAGKRDFEAVIGQVFRRGFANHGVVIDDKNALGHLGNGNCAGLWGGHGGPPLHRGLQC